MTRSRRLPLLVLALVLVAAAGGLFLMHAPRGRREAFAPQAKLASAFALARSDSDSSPSAPLASPEPQGDALAAGFAAQRLVRTASLTLEVGRYDEAARKAEAIAIAQGGYLADASAAREAGDRERGTLTLRVQADRFAEALRALEALGKVESASVQTQDIGREYLDLETRLATRRDTEVRLREILRTQTARLSDVLAAEKELSRVIEEREVLEGQRRFYDRQMALSTFTVEIHEPATFLREGAFSPLGEALRRVLPLLSASVAALLYAVAAALPWALVGFLIWRLRRRFSARRLIRVATEG